VTAKKIERKKKSREARKEVGGGKDVCAYRAGRALVSRQEARTSRRHGKDNNERIKYQKKTLRQPPRITLSKKSKGKKRRITVTYQYEKASQT